MQGNHEQANAAQLLDAAQLLHDLNQPLSAINTYAQAGIQLAGQELADPARLKDLFGKIAQQCARAAVLSQSLRKAVTPAGHES
jgi:C4-dicarboxylate-specific signal transduction histidine kinase